MENAEIKLTEDMIKFVEKMGLYYENYGVPRIGGKILGLILIVNKPISAEQISSLLKISRGSVSTNIRLLLTYGFLERTTSAGERTDYFIFSSLAWDNAIKVRIDGFKSLKAIVEQGISASDGERNENEGLAQMLEWVNLMIEGHIKVLDEWENR